MDIMRLRGAQMRIQGAGKKMAELFPNSAGSSSVGGCKQLLGRFIEVGGLFFASVPNEHPGHYAVFAPCRLSFHQSEVSIYHSVGFGN